MNNWDYAELVKQAAMAGGPEKFTNGLIAEGALIGGVTTMAIIIAVKLITANYRRIVNYDRSETSEDNTQQSNDDQINVNCLYDDDNNQINNYAEYATRA